MAGNATTPPETLIKALAIGWSLGIFNGTTTLVLQGPPRVRGGILRGQDWLLLVPVGLALTGFETISLTPTACNHGLALSLPKDAPDPRLRWRANGCIAVTHKTAPKLPDLPPGHRAIGLSMAPRASSSGHPFAETLPQTWQALRQAAENAIRGDLPLPDELPRNLLRCVIRDMAGRAPSDRLSQLAHQHDRPLYRALSG